MLSVMQSSNEKEIMKIIAGLEEKGRNGAKRAQMALPLPPQSVITPGDIRPFKKQFGATKSRRWHAALAEGGGTSAWQSNEMPSCLAKQMVASKVL